MTTLTNHLDEVWARAALLPAREDGARWVPRDAIVVRGGNQTRDVFIDDEHVERLRQAADRLPPLLVQTGTFVLIGGHHRLHALEGRDVVAVFEEDVPDSLMWEWAVRDNVAHGKPMTTRERMANARRLWERHQDWSGPKLAEWTGVAHSTFSKWAGEAAHKAAVAAEKSRGGVSILETPPERNASHTPVKSKPAPVGRDGRVNTGGRPRKEDSARSPVGGFDPGRDADFADDAPDDVDPETGEIVVSVGNEAEFVAMFAAVAAYAYRMRPTPGRWLRNLPAGLYDATVEALPEMASLVALFEGAVAQAEAE